MGSRNFREMLEARWAQGNFVCVGLDSDYPKLPASVRDGRLPGDAMFKFNQEIVGATHGSVLCYKPQISFYEAMMEEGLRALGMTVGHVQAVAPDVPVIIDAKRADIGNTNEGYVRALFDSLGADAITVNPYLGGKALEPFLSLGEDKGIIVLCKTSNPGAGEFQDLPIMLPREKLREIEQHLGREIPEGSVPLYLYVAYRVAKHWNERKNCALVVGATYPNELKRVREMVGDMPILIPGIGAQGGDLEATVAAGKDSRDRGMIINSSRGIIFASSGEDFAEAARRETIKLRDQVRACLPTAA